MDIIGLQALLSNTVIEIRFPNHAFWIELYQSERTSCHIYLLPPRSDIRLMSNHITETWREKGKKIYFMVEVVVSKTDNNAITILKQGQLKVKRQAYICDWDHVVYINSLQIEYWDFDWSPTLHDFGVSLCWHEHGNSLWMVDLRIPTGCPIFN